MAILRIMVLRHMLVMIGIFPAMFSGSRDPTYWMTPLTTFTLSVSPRAPST